MITNVRILWFNYRSSSGIDIYSIEKRSKVLIRNILPPLRSRNKRISNFLGWLRRTSRIKREDYSSYIGYAMVDWEELLRFVKEHGYNS